MENVSSLSKIFGFWVFALNHYKYWPRGWVIWNVLTFWQPRLWYHFYYQHQHFHYYFNFLLNFISQVTFILYVIWSPPKTKDHIIFPHFIVEETSTQSSDYMTICTTREWQCPVLSQSVWFQVHILIQHITPSTIQHCMECP